MKGFHGGEEAAVGVCRDSLFNIIHNLQKEMRTKSPGLWMLLTSLGQSNAMPMARKSCRISQN